MKTIIQKCAWRTARDGSNRTFVVDDVCASRDGFGTYTLESFRERNLVKQSYKEGVSLKVGETRTFEHLSCGPWGPLWAKHTVTRNEQNVVTMIDNGIFGGNLGAYVISSSRDALTKYSDNSYTPVVYRGFIRALLRIG